MARRLAGKIAVVTGGTTGIGFASAKRFAAEGARVFITGRRQAELDTAVAAIGGNATGVQADCAKMSDLNRLYALVKADAGRIDILFANAGGGSNLPLGSITEEQYDDTFGRNVKGVLFTVQKALPLLVDGASVILTGSTASVVAMPAFSVYGAALPVTGRSISRSAGSGSCVEPRSDKDARSARPRRRRPGGPAGHARSDGSGTAARPGC